MITTDHFCTFLISIDIEMYITRESKKIISKKFEVFPYPVIIV